MMRPWAARLLAPWVALALVAVGCASEATSPAPPVGEGEDEPGSTDEPDARPDDPDPTPAPADPEEGGTAAPVEPSEPDSPGAPPADPEGPLDETGTPPMRAVWVHLFDETLKHRDGIARLIEELVTADATAVIAQVARRHDAYYRSKVLPATTDPDLEPGLDVVAELTRRAQEVGIEVHAWFSIAPTWHPVYEPLPAPDGWVATEHGRTANEGSRWVSRTRDGVWTEYLDPGVPAVRDHVAAVVTELAATTEVDGIHLDYVRYENERAGYHPIALQRYRSETGTAGTPAVDDPRWSDWRRAQTRALLDRARLAIADVEREVELSAAVVTWGPGPAEAGGFDGTRTATEALQDWPSWVRDGALDSVLPMNYFRAHLPEQAAWFGDWLTFEEQLATEHRTRVVPGIAGWLNDADAVGPQLGTALDATDGAALYSYQQPAEDAVVDPEAAAVRPFWGGLATSDWGAGSAR